MNAIAPRIRRTAAVAAVSLLLVAGLASAAGGLLDRSFRPLAGKQAVNLRGQYGGQVLLVVNTASKCGFTPQFEALEGLHAKYKGQGFAVLGFPSGDFKAQEFEDEKQIQEFCTLTYGVKFPMFEKVHVVGEQATPLYQDLARSAGEAPKWNFHKYLIGRDGKLIASYGSKIKPDDPTVVAAIEAALKAPRPKKAG
ncbi:MULTISPECIES: glutathione peroxidase [unclassified Lysobacter]|uniref:glutathione peroxidase n=1 Tax=unclassified Lysobacter TaxID=2635362 RepID=UPI0006F5E380|nr:MULTISPECIES: glutathione peroxidase [unclassified Lysobacter]KRA20623.1 cobalamin ABC transporter permease [Lysobacter sp. Root604]KRD39645.1 cobalamin ABC transporter permease [Lysobacter sp. Root916]KRD79612.1 cobalamin ABC transporter permease [Lysobacter sp. Root983]